MAYDPRFSGGVRVAAGDVEGNGGADIIVAPGPGGGPDVKVFDKAGDVMQYATHPGLKDGFFAFDPGFTGGVYVTVADTNGDGRDEIIVSAGAGGGPGVKVFDSLSLAVQQYPGRPDLTDGFYAYDPSFSGGVRVSAFDVNGDGKIDLVMSSGSGTPEPVVAVDAATLTQLDDFFAFGQNFQGGLYVGGA
jgi:hypothetical protein